MTESRHAGASTKTARTVIRAGQDHSPVPDPGQPIAAPWVPMEPANL